MGLAPLGASYKNVKIIVSCCVKEKDDNEVTELRISSFQKNNVIFSLYFTVIIFSAKQNPRKSLELEGCLLIIGGIVPGVRVGACYKNDPH